MPKYVVRYGSMRILGVFDAGGGAAYARSSRVIIRTDRGLEAGEVLCDATEQARSHLVDPREGHILRSMTADDLREQARIHEHEKDEYQICLKAITKLGLAMELVDVEHIFGGERILVYYLAEGRIDFRELVKVLASEFQTRIEMRQIGVRDEAKLLADYGDCGQPVCCNTHLVKMPPVSMKMAKLQKATLDPTKISGRCGRLKCCLRYEYDTYEEVQKALPPLGTRITAGGVRGRVVGHELLAGQVVVETDDRVRKLVSVSEIVPLAEKPPRAEPRQADPRGVDANPSGITEAEPRDD